MLKRMWGRRNTPPLLVGVQTGPELWKSVWRFLGKLVSNLPRDPAIPLLGIYPTDAQSYHNNMCSMMFAAPLFVIARSWKQPKSPSTKEWIKKAWYIHTMEYYTVGKK